MKSIDVLVVDDSPDTTSEFEKKLQSYDLSFKSTNRVKPAIRIAKKEKPRLVFVDLFLPELDGFDLADQIFKINSECSVVLMSGIYDFDEKHLHTLGIQDFLKKPIDFTKVDEILKKHHLVT